MTNVVGFFFIAIIFLSCSSGKPDNDQKIKVKQDERLKGLKINLKKDQVVADYITTYYDSVSVKEYKSFLIVKYILGQQENFISFDSLRHVYAIHRLENGKTTFLREYYPNGQAKAEITFVNGKINGVAIYYREDGTIRSVAQHGLEDGKLSVIREYDANGRQTEVKEYDAVGSYLKERSKNK